MSLPRPYSHGERAALATIAMCFCLLIITALAFQFDERLLRGVNIWSKPVKFAASFGLHLATLLVFVRLLSNTARGGRPVAVALIAASVATLIEVLYVTLQSARGRASHFNTETAWESFMYYQVMGGAALVLIGSTIAIGVLVLRNARSDVGEGLRLGAGWGAIISAISTLVVAGALASGVLSGPGPWIGMPRTDAGGMPIVGWSREAGDLRVPHFIATHLIQGAALMGWLADRANFAPLGASRLAVLSALALGLLLTGASFWQALNGAPLLTRL